MARIRVLLADDEVLVRAGVRAILATDDGIEVVAEAADGREAIELVRSHRPDVVLLDIRMPGLDGLRAAGEIARLAPGTSVVILTTFGQDDYIGRALGGGAAFLSPAIARRVIDGYSDAGRDRAARARRRVEALTDRERDVLGLLGAGHSNAEIARTLHLVEGTVKAHVSSILIKLEVRNRVQAAILAYEAGLTH